MTVQEIAEAFECNVYDYNEDYLELYDVDGEPVFIFEKTLNPRAFLNKIIHWKEKQDRLTGELHFKWKIKNLFE